MRRGPAAAAWVVALLAVSGEGRADPIFAVPEARAAGGGWLLDARLLGVVGAERLATWPDRELGLEPRDPVAASLRAGVVWNSQESPWSFVAQLDLAEFLRPAQAGEEPWERPAGELSGALVDDAYVMWRPSRLAEVVLGRARVPFSKWRQFDERDIALGAAPFLIDRVAPDRRWGLLLHGDLGAMAYAAGAWEDVDALEPRRADGDDPSAGGRVAASVQVEWTPIAPMMGSNPVGKVTGAHGPLPTPRSDPWFDTGRVSLGLGVLWRLGESGTQRVDATLSAEWKWRWWSALAEAVVVDSKRVGGHGEIAATPWDRLSLHVRGEWDPGEPEEAAWTLGVGAMWHATADRRSRIGVFAWQRRVTMEAGQAERKEDAAIVLIQTAL
jgi:hypothetical protein